MAADLELHETPYGVQSRTEKMHQASPRAKALEEYMRSREVYRYKAVAILVDAFRHISAYLESCQEFGHAGGRLSSTKSFHVLFFLSHFHSDHYNGITSGWRHGTIYASRATANILCWRLGVRETSVKKMDFGLIYVFSLENGELLYEEAGCEEGKCCRDGCFSVTMIPANHCPGAVMFLFQSPAFGTILHTGDFRFSSGRSSSTLQRLPSPVVPSLPCPLWNLDITNNPLLGSVAGKVDTLFLDNTFCDPRFIFPSHVDVLREVNMAVLSMFCERTTALQSCSGGSETLAHKSKSVGNTISLAVMIGAYFIGKERIALSLQETFLPDCDKDDEALRFVPTYVSPEKYESLRQLEYFSERFVPLPQNSSSVSSGGGNDEDNDGVSTVLSGFTKHKVRLPQESSPASPNVARDLFSSFSENFMEDSWERLRYCLTLFMVPLTSVTYPTLAAVCGVQHPKRRRGEQTVEDVPSAASHNGRALPLWGSTAIDLKQFDGVLCVEPTGWTKKVSTHRINKLVTLLRVPYSEHSSFNELVDFVGFVNPSQVVPTVSPELYKKYESLFAERAPRLRQRYSNVQPLSRFLLPKSTPVTEVRINGTLNDTPGTGAEARKQRNPFTMAITATDVTCIDGVGGDDDDDVCTVDTPSVQVGDVVNMQQNKQEDRYCAGFRHRRYDSTIKVEHPKSCMTGRLECAKQDIEDLSYSLNNRQTNTQSSILRWAQSSGKADSEEDDDDCVLVESKPSFIEISDTSD
ncbi:DNA cross-link repair 1A protein [Trypanosoma grayi]|uniref:DNA cross-link repair 1A protein n=1 Tax=Trypanosoma grayi TaxID=71804 RepID=UPI0004F4740F|nr:DNA cross-link repair 1A protein [Trypanosoma grayi]KEG15302.1 DNA cross-link repair 1A protein [Trypanosoma grayi]